MMGRIFLKQKTTLFPRLSRRNQKVGFSGMIYNGNLDLVCVNQFNVLTDAENGSKALGCINIIARASKFQTFRSEIHP